MRYMNGTIIFLTNEIESLMIQWMHTSHCPLHTSQDLQFWIPGSSLFWDRIVVGICDNQIRKKLLQVSKLSGKDCIGICRSYETTNQLKAMSQEEVCIAEGKKFASSIPGDIQIQCKFCTGCVRETNLSAQLGKSPASHVASRTILQLPASLSHINQ